MIEDFTPEIKITKQDKDSGEKLKGAKYSIYKLNDEGDREKTIATGLTTNAEGVVTLRTGINVNNVYEIEETKAPSGYELNEKTKKITLKKGENAVVFKNEKYNFRITVHKIDSDTQERLEGAVFGIFRYGPHDNGGFELDADKNFISVPASDKPNSNTYAPSNSYIPLTREDKTRFFVPGCSGNKHYWYSSDFYSHSGTRSNWYMKNADGNYVDYVFSDDYTAANAPIPYISTTLYEYAAYKDDDGNWTLNDKGTKYKLKLITSTTTYMEVRSENRGNNWWRKHYKPKCYSKSDKAFVFCSLSDMRTNSNFQLTTDDDGEITITGDAVEQVRYWGEEIKAPKGYNIVGGKQFYIGKPTPENKKIKYTKENEWPRGNLLLKKVNYDQPNLVMNGVKFRFKCKGVGWVQASGNTYKYVKKKADATVFTTGVNGKTANDGCIYIQGLRSGDYQYEEDLESLQNSNPKFVATNEGMGEFTVTANIENQATVKNPPKFISLSGDIWDDGRTFKDGKNDNLYDPLGATGEDKKLSPEQYDKITVSLIVTDPNGNIDTSRCQTAKPDRNTGHWKMELVEIALINHENQYWNLDLGGIDFTNYHYYIEFSYDGLIYDAVTPWDTIDSETVSRMKDPTHNGNKPNVDQWFETIRNQKGSKARESVTSRETLNAKFAKVDGVSDSDKKVQAKNDDGTVTSDVTYDLYDKKGGSKDTAAIKDATNVAVTAKIDNDSLYYDRYNDASYEIKYINLGLKEKLQADLALLQDVEEVDVGIKGEHHVYKYNSVGNQLSADENVANNKNAELKEAGEYNEYTHVEPSIYDNVGVTFGDYTQPVYRADFVYNNNEDTNKNLDIIMTYKITLKNQTSYKTRINNIIEYFDNRYTVYKIGTGLNDQHHITGEFNTFNGLGTVTKNSYTYNKIKINLPESDYTLGSYTTKNLYIQFKFANMSALASIIKDASTKEGEKVNGYQNLENSAEITSYTTFKNDKYYAVVDGDSVLDNANTRNEDDTWNAPGIGLVLKDAREIKGYVFKDATDQNKLKNENIRQGDGQYSSGDDKLKGIKVELLELNGDSYGQVKYMGDTSFTTTTDNNGQYSLSGFAPGKYIVRFTWGGSSATYKPTEYKATIYNNDIYNYSSSNTDWFKKIKTTGKDTQLNKSYALDDWEIRTTIDNKLNVDGGDYNFASKDDSTKGYDINSINTRQMQSNTLQMKFQIEYDDNDITNLNVVSNKDGQSTSAKFVTESINFGITERPVQKISMEKRLKNIKLKYSSEEAVVDADISRDGILDGATNYTSYIGSSRNRRKALVRIEADTEILQNSSMEAIYELIFRNESEREYKDKNFYNFGIVPTNELETVVKITPSKIMDYLSNESTLKVNSDINTQVGWELKTKDDIVASKIVSTENGYLNTIKNDLIYLATTAAPAAPKLTQKTMEDSGLTVADKNNIEKSQRYESILEIETEKRLSANYEDKEDIANQVEVVAAQKGFGRRIETTTIPGNFIPNKSAQEADDSMGEIITIISSTGANKNYVIPVTIGIIILSAIAIGIYYVKKKNRN